MPAPTKPGASAALGPNLLVARATQLAADGIGAVDAQIAQVASIRVDPSIAPSLASDLAALDSTLASWAEGLRGLAIKTMQTLVVDDERLASEWPGVDRNDPNALLGFARAIQSVVGADETAVVALQKALGPFDDGIESALSRIRADSNAVAGELANAEARARGLQAQVDAAQSRIDYLKSHPWVIILEGLALPALIAQLVDLIDALKTANAALDRLHQVQAQIAQLQAGQGPLLALSMALTGLSGGVGNMVTALQQTSAKLAQIIETPPLPPILAAQLDTMMQDLAASRGIAAEILQGT